MFSPFLLFVDDFLRMKKLPTDAHVADKAFHGTLRKQLGVFERDVNKVIPTFEKNLTLDEIAAREVFWNSLGRPLEIGFRRRLRCCL